MREATLIMPAADNHGNSLSGLLQNLGGSLIETFGGFTVTPGHGGWRADNGREFLEPVHVFTVAMDLDDENNARLRHIAESFGRAGNQLSVYVRFASGEVEIIDIRPEQIRLAS
jgi:hypothetical protein